MKRCVFKYRERDRTAAECLKFSVFVSVTQRRSHRNVNYTSKILTVCIFERTPINVRHSLVPNREFDLVLT